MVGLPDGNAARLFPKAGGGSNGGDEPEHVVRMRKALESAKAELRGLRQRRLELEVKPAEQRDSPKLPMVGPDDVAMKALAAHGEPPPAMLHRLGIAVMLILEAPLLVDLGEHPLPARVPWRNLQILLRKPQATVITGGDASLAPMKDIVAALTSRPFGERLVRHIHHKVLEGDPPLTRSEVLDADANCTPLHDWVINLLLPFQASQRAMMLPAPETAEVRAERDNATAAVASKEKEVAGLRRKLRAAQESEQAAVEFAAQHSPGPASDGPESTSTPAANGSSTLDSGSVGPVPNGTLEVMGQKSLQYRLEEVVVPELQEAVLQSVVKTLLERTESESSSARVEVVGRSEDREDEATAQQRAEAVEAWLLARGVPRERLSVSWAAGGKATARSTELRLLDVPGKEAKVRQKAETLLRRIQGYPEPAATPASPPEPAVAAPTWQLEELAQQRLRLVFRKEGLVPEDAVLEVGAKAVRLASLAGNWPEVEVELPREVMPPEEPSAKFSRKNGTLTVTLNAV
ncbi:unnamed protein product [Effrenium voratum]|uniref:Uncharacterized protein n=1 Tax=Effrenium voratum TaxID=2562239 RepID=A0AA36J6U7_9DINO|nr:unnamed protein product [Effrenium voratum]CAJ1400682.1 unnamed protein product [Effrenium voratum]CAJ1461083.1 unnamed protein product [Effrenium voratum]